MTKKKLFPLKIISNTCWKDRVLNELHGLILLQPNKRNKKFLIIKLEGALLLTLKALGVILIMRMKKILFLVTLKCLQLSYKPWSATFQEKCVGTKARA